MNFRLVAATCGLATVFLATRLEAGAIGTEDAYYLFPARDVRSVSAKGSIYWGYGETVRSVKLECRYQDGRKTLVNGSFNTSKRTWSAVSPSWTKGASPITSVRARIQYRDRNNRDQTYIESLWFGVRSP